jgi:CRP-like cAMP-binding protein
MTSRALVRTVSIMTTRSEYLEELAGIPLFDGCWRRDLELIARNVEVVDVDDGAVIVTEGDNGHELYVVADGAATVSRDGRPLAVIGAGDWFGESAALAGCRHPATVSAAGPTRLVVIGRREVLALAQAVPGLARRLLRGMAERLGKEDSGGSVSGRVTQEVRDDPGEAPQPRGAVRP